MRTDVYPSVFRCTAFDAICGFSVGDDVLGVPPKRHGISFGNGGVS